MAGPCRHILFQKLDRDTEEIIRASPSAGAPHQLPHADQDVFRSVEAVQSIEKLGRSEMGGEKVAHEDHFFTCE